MKKMSIFAFAAVAVVVAARAADIEFSIGCDRQDHLYSCGETARFTVTAASGECPVQSNKVVEVVLDNFGERRIASGKWDVVATNVFEISGTLTEPGFLRLTLRRGGKTVKVWSAGFEPHKIRKGSPSPDDFDDFWARAQAKLAKEVPLDPQLVRICERSTEKFDFYRVSFATFGRRVYGYLSVPTDKTKAPFPVNVEVNAAGFGSWTNDMAGRDDAISLRMSVYPFEMDWKWQKNGTKAKYDELNAEMRKKYKVSAYSTAGISESREEYFFYPVVLGINRAVDWVVARPDVDRSRIRYQGTSQGGGFGFYLCALNRNFTRAAFFVPAITDTMGYLSGRQSGWPKIVESNSASPKQRAAAEKWAPYFDGANFASRITCPVRVVVGFADVTCAPCAVYAAFNAISSSDKKIDHGIGMGHGCRKEFYRKYGEWLTEPAGRRKCN